MRNNSDPKSQSFGKVNFEIDDQVVSLSLFWVLGYGGGVFFPFRYRTNQQEIHRGGRYLLDIMRWHCPLAPPENWLPDAVRAGENQYLEE